MLQSVQDPPVLQSHCAAVHCGLGAVPPGPATGESRRGNYDDTVYTTGYYTDHSELLAPAYNRAGGKSPDDIHDWLCKERGAEVKETSK